MGMMIRRHRVTDESVKPVKQTEPETIVEMPKVEYEQVAVTEVVEEPEKEPEKEPKTKTVRHTTKTTATRKAGRPAKRK